MIERQPIRAAKCRALHRAFGYGIVAVGTPGHNQNIPLKACGGRVGTVFVPVHDVPKHVVGARVGGIDRRLALLPAIAVVGERTVDAAAGVRIDGYPLRAIHFRRPHHVGRQTGFNQQIALACKTVAFIQAILPEDQRQPVAAAVLVEPGDVQRAGRQQLHIGFPVRGIVFFIRDKLIDVLKLLVVAHVDHHAIIGGERDGGPLMLEAAERGVLARGGGRVVGIDLHHPAETVGFVRGFINAEPLIHLVPAVRFIAVADAVAFFQRVEIGFFDKNVRPVLLAGEIGAPQRVAVGAVLHGAQNAFPLRVGGGFH